jgi:hypothetical protein
VLFDLSAFFSRAKPVNRARGRDGAIAREKGMASTAAFWQDPDLF